MFSMFSKLFLKLFFSCFCLEYFQDDLGFAFTVSFFFGESWSHHLHHLLQVPPPSTVGAKTAPALWTFKMVNHGMVGTAVDLLLNSEFRSIECPGSFWVSLSMNVLNFICVGRFFSFSGYPILAPAPFIWPICPSLSSGFRVPTGCWVLPSSVAANG
jgi:hypothetical protein